MVVIRVGDLNYDPKKILGRGNFGTVFKGFFADYLFGELYDESLTSRPAAIKRMERASQNVNHESDIKQEMELMQKPEFNHTHILSYICSEIDDNFLYIATELCRGTLKEYVNKEYQGPKFEGAEWQILYQVTQGLAHLHKLEIIHRDIKPTNILIFVEGSDLSARNTNKPQIKLADFGISKFLKTDKDDFTNTNVSNPSGTKGWMAPEVYQSNRIDFKVDIWALGCIFGYTLSGGKHPFGDDVIRRIFRIIEKEPMVMVREDLKEPYNSKDEVAFELIQSMLDVEPSIRPETADLLNHPFFVTDWVRTQRLLKICGPSYKSGIEEQILYDEFQTLIEYEKGIDVNAKTTDGRTPLHLLCHYFEGVRLIHLVRHLILKGADVNARDSGGETPLHLLCKNYAKDNLGDVVQLLIQNGAQVDVIETKDGITPLHLLCKHYKRNNLIDVIEPFLVVDLVNAQTEYDGETPLYFLCESYSNENLIDIVKLFIRKGADVNVKMRDLQGTLRYGGTPLHALCRRYKKDNLIDLAQLFIQNCVDLNAKDNNGATPLHVFLKYYVNDNLNEIVQLLVENGANINAKSKNGETPLHVISEYYTKADRMLNVIQHLIQLGAEVNAEANNGETPLSLLCQRYHLKNMIEVVQFLIEKGANAKVKTKSGWTPLHNLCQNYNQDNFGDLVQLLIRNGADANAKNGYGDAPLHYLISYYYGNNMGDRIRILLQINNVDVKDAGHLGETPLHLLCKRYRNHDIIELIELLIAKGAKVKAETKNGCTPLHYLCENYDNDNLLDVVRYLVRKGGKNDSKVKEILRNKGVLAPSSCRLS